MQGFTKLEEAVLLGICRTSANDRDIIESQLKTAVVRSRTNTGAGFYTHFDVSRGTLRIFGSPRNGGWASVEGLNNPMGFLLWLKDGYADHLEGFSIDDTTTDLNLSALTFEMLPNSN